MLWRGQIQPVYDYYQLGRPRGILTEAELPQGLVVRSGGVFVCADLHTSDVHLEVIQVSEGRQPADAIEVTVGSKGWGLRTLDGTVQDAPEPLLGQGRWALALSRSYDTPTDRSGGIQHHTLTVAPLDDGARTFTPKPQKSPRRPRPTRWRPSAGTYQVVVKHGTGQDVATVTTTRQSDWYLDPATEEFMPLGEKWAIRREWQLNPGDTITVTDNDGVSTVTSPFATGPAHVRLTERRNDIGDLVQTEEGTTYSLPEEDGFQLEVIPGP